MARLPAALPRLALLASLGTIVLAGPSLAAPASSRIATVAGGGSGGFSGDGGAATAALLTSPSDVAAAGTGGAYLIADTSNHRIRRVDAAGVITTVAGGDGQLNQPRGVSPTSDGGFLIADTGNSVIRRVSPTGIMSVVAGTPGVVGSGGDGGPASGALLNRPEGVAALADGSYLIADTGNDVVRLVSATGVITRVAGTVSSTRATSGGTFATSSSLSAPARAVPLTGGGGGFLVADTGNNRIRKVAANGTVTTIAGTGVPGSAGDGGPATAAQLNGPEGLAVRTDGSVVIADATGERIREIAPDGLIRTIAGTGTLGFAGDGGDPLAAQVSHPRGVAVLGARLWIADTFNHRIRLITTTPATTDPVVPETVPEHAPPGVSPPQLRRSAVVTPTAGRVRVRPEGASGFSDLHEAANLPLGSEVDTTGGTATVFFVTNDAGRTATGIASQGRFVLDQPRGLDRGQHAGQLDLSGPLAGCSTARRGPARAAAAGPTARAAAAKKKGRRVKVHAKGRIKTRGKYGSAIVRGTRWTMVDRCASDPKPGTYVSVTEGVVSVRDFTRNRSVLVKRGQTYLAPAKKR